MLFTGLCLKEVADSFMGKRGLVKQTILVVSDVEGELTLRNTVDYVMDEEKDAAFKGKCAMCHVSLNVGDVFGGMSGRLRLRGKIVKVVK